MTSPDGFEVRINALVTEAESIQLDTPPEAKIALKEIRQLQKELRMIKTEISGEIRIIRAEFRERAVSAGSGGSLVLGIFGKRRLAGTWRASAKRDLAAERDRAVFPYEALKRTIDDLILQLDRHKLAAERIAHGGGRPFDSAPSDPHE